MQIHCNPVETTSLDFLNVSFVLDSDVRRPIRRLKSAGPDHIPSSIIKGFSEIFVPVLKHIFNLSLASGGFPSLWKEAAVLAVFKKGSSPLVTNYRPVSFINIFSNFF
jgi:hypothetical protein